MSYSLRSRTWLFPLIVFSLLGGSSAWAGDSKCTAALRKFLPVVHEKSERAFDKAAYDAERASLAAQVAEIKADPKRLLELLNSGTPPTPEKLFALIDALNPRAETSFAKMITAIEELGDSVTLRNYRFPFGYVMPRSWVATGSGHPADVAPSYRHPFTLYKSFPFVWRDRILTLQYPNVAPRTPQELVDLVHTYSRALTLYRVYRVSAASPWLSLPAGTGPRAFPELIMGHLLESEKHMYGTLHALRTLYPETEIPLPPTDRIWKWNYLGMAWETIPRIINPFYNPTRRYRPNEAHYNLFLDSPEKLSAELDRKYRGRARIKWVADQWRRTLMGLIAYSTYNTSAKLYHFFVHGDWQLVWAKINELNLKYSPARVNQAVEAYEEDEEGFDLVNKFYDDQIKELEAQIAKHGDPKGVLAKKIEELKKRRDRLKN